VNVALLAPLWMQVVHLLLADTLWILLLLTTAETLTLATETAAEPMAKLSIATGD
jgi:cytochrome c oxidase assembly protein subunit 15